MILTQRTLCFLITLVGCCEILTAQWQHIGSPDTGHAYHYAFTSDRIYVCASGGLFYSDDVAQSWTSVPLPDTVCYFNEIYEHRNILFLLSREIPGIEDAVPVLYRSEDGGETWKSVYPIQNHFGFYYLTAPAFKGDTMVIAHGDEIAISTDLGKTFVLLESPAEFRSIFFHGDQLMGFDSRTLYSSITLGASWSTTYTSPASLDFLSVSSIAGKLYKFEGSWAGPDFIGYFSQSINDGNTWAEISQLSKWYFSAPCIFGDSNYLFMIEELTDHKLFRSSDHGLSWEPLDLDGKFFRFQYMQGVLFGVQYYDYDGAWLSFDQGNLFQEKSNGLIAADCQEIIYSADQVWTVANVSLFRLVGTQWDAVTGYENIVRGDDLHLMCFINGELNRSEDGGHQWQLVPATLFEEINFTHFSYLQGAGNVFIVRVNSDLWYSIDFGITWNPFTALASEKSQFIVFDGNQYTIGTWLGYMYRSTDGVGWENITYNLKDLGVWRLEAIHTLDGYSFIVTNRNHYVLTPGSNHWDPLTIPQNESFDSPVKAAINNFTHVESILLCAAYGHGVFFSADYGASWEPYNESLYDLQARDIEVVGEDLYLAVNGGIWKRSLAELTSVGNPPSLYSCFTISTTRDQLHVLSPDQDLPYTISLFAVDGRLITSQVFSNSQQPIDISQLPAGWYAACIRNMACQSTIAFVKS